MSEKGGEISRRGFFKNIAGAGATFVGVGAAVVASRFVKAGGEPPKVIPQVSEGPSENQEQQSPGGETPPIPEYYQGEVTSDEEGKSTIVIPDFAVPAPPKTPDKR